MTIVRFGDAPVFDLSCVRIRGFASFTREGDEALILTSMPVGTLPIRDDGERVAPPWSE